MKQLQLIVIFLICMVGSAAAQAPVNDDCNGVIDLGVAPICETDVFYTNIDATASDIGFGNELSCFNGGTTQNDVWFAFTTADTIMDYTFTVQGTEMGPNGQGLENPQIALYRGSCQFDGLAELACISADNGATLAQLEIFGLSINTTYFIRINDYSPSATPNWGDFTFCVEEYLPALNIGDSEGSQSCFGTLYDSGGPDEEYGDGENHTFTICPQDFHECIAIDLVDFGMENNVDFLNFYAGDDTGAPLIASISGFSTGADFPIQASSDCVTIEFISDGSVTGLGFELTWQCTSSACAGDEPIVIDAIPFNEDDFSTCESGASFAETACVNVPFLNGPETVFVYEAPGGFCSSIEVTNADLQTGVVVLDGPPLDPNSNCIATSELGFIASANFEDAGTYYIVVANGGGCTDFGLNMEVADCGISPSLEDALCNPLNGCVELDGLPSVFIFDQGFEDMDLVEGVNSGCWIFPGIQPDYYWFTIEAQADGPFGFILQGAQAQSDIDYNVWGPFEPEEVCEDAAMVREFIENNQPIRSSWAGGNGDLGGVGLADTHPLLGYTIEDDFDCGNVNTPGAGGDDFTRAIQAQEGEVYVVLINDFGDAIAEGGISVDWNPSNPSVIDPLPAAVVVQGDTAICPGDMAQLVIESTNNNITWLNGTESLSCNNCLTPIASPTETTTYRGVVEGECYESEVVIKVTVYALDAGSDQTVCRGEDIQIVSGANTTLGIYNWTTDSPDVMLSCTDCPDPVVTSNTAGTYTLSVTLEAPTCSFSDEMTLTVLPQTAPVFEARDSVFLCNGEDTDLMIDAPATNGYIWTSDPAGFTSLDPNPTVEPTDTTVYYVAVSNGICPFPSTDSVYVEVSERPVIAVPADMSLCQGSSIALANIEVEEDVTYMWTGPGDIADPTDPNSMATPQSSGTYTLTATRGACVEIASFDVEVTPIDIDINNGIDTIAICLGETIGLIAATTPATEMAEWSPAEGLSATTGNLIQATPTVSTFYFATVAQPGCEVTDTIFVQVDSLPSDLSIMPADTTICLGAVVELISPTYEPGDFMNIEFMWTPMAGQQSPDSLYNLVVTPSDSTIYQRITTSGACVDTTTAAVNVIPPVTIMVTPENPEICAGESVNLMTSAEEPLENFMWMPETGLSCTDCADPTASPSVTTMYTVQAETEGGSCPAMGSVEVVVALAPTFLAPTDTEACEGSGESFVLNGITNPEFTYSWTSTDPSFVPTSDAAPVVTPTATATYTVVIQNGDCPSVTREVTINVLGSSVLSVPESQSVCEGDPLSLTAESTDFGAFTWTNPSGAVVSEDATFEVPTDTEGFVVYTVTFENECETLTDSVRVTTIGAIMVDSLTCSPDLSSIAQGTELTFTLYTNPSAEDLNNPSYEWTNGDGTVFGTAQSATFEIINAPEETISVLLTTANGCMVEASKTLQVDPADIKIPNVFTPNNDGANDTFNAVVKGNIEITAFRIYNRWGQLVFDDHTNANGWDGRFNEKLAPSDVYIYYIAYLRPGATVEEIGKGDVTLVR